MRRELDSIDIIFENCDCVTIDKADCQQICLNDLNRELLCDRTGCVIETETAESCTIILKSSADKEYLEFGQEAEKFKNTIFNRIKSFRDITSIALHTTLQTDASYDIPSTRLYYVKWTGEDEYINPAQHLFCFKDGSIGIYIDENFDVTDIDGEEWNYK